MDVTKSELLVSAIDSEREDMVKKGRNENGYV